MRRIIIALVISTALSGIASAAERPASELTVTAAGGRVESFTGSKDLSVKFWLQQLALSALYRNDVESSTSAEWDQAGRFASKIHCAYPSGSHIALPERQVLTFDEILVPIGDREYPEFIYLKNGESYSRLAKYDPWLFWKLKAEAGLTERIPETVPRSLF